MTHGQTFGSFVRECRKARGITLRGLAARLGLSPVYMSNIETDRRAAPTQEHLEKLAKELALDKAGYEPAAGSGGKVKDPACILGSSGVHHGTGHCRAALRTAKEVDATDEEAGIH